MIAGTNQPSAEETYRNLVWAQRRLGGEVAVFDRGGDPALAWAQAIESHLAHNAI